MSNKKPIPNDIYEHRLNSLAYRNLRDVYAKLPFGGKKAIKFAKLEEKENSTFLSKIGELYPDIKNARSYSWNDMAKEVWRTDGKEDQPQ